MALCILLAPMGGKILFLKHPFSISFFVGDVLKKDWKDSGTL
jgi:hypothetical protein